MSAFRNIDDEVKVNVGNRIRNLRKSLGISQETLALRAELDRTYVTSIENGKRNVSIVNLERIASALDCGLKELFNSAEFEKSLYAHALTYYRINNYKNYRKNKIAEKDNNEYN